MRVEKATTLLAVTCLLASGPSAAAQQREATAQTRVLQGCLSQTNASGQVSRGEDAATSAPIFWLDTARDAGHADDRSVHSSGQSGQRAGQQQMPTGQQTQAGQEPMAAVMDEDEPTVSRPTRYRIVTADEGVGLAAHVGQRVEVEGTVSSGIPAHRRHDGRAVPQGVGAPMTGLPGPGGQAGQPGPHYTSPDDEREVAGTLTVSSVRVLRASCTTDR